MCIRDRHTTQGGTHQTALKEHIARTIKEFYNKNQDYGGMIYKDYKREDIFPALLQQHLLFHYLKNYKNYLIGMSGEGNYYLFGKRFEVEISEDLQTLSLIHI